MASRIFALIIWAAVAASLAYWGLRWLARPTGVPVNATPVSMDSGPAQPDASAASALASRMKLLGVVAPRQEDDHSGIALLSIDGKPPKAIRVGSVIEGETVLQSLTQHGAAIGPAGGPAAATLDLPLLPPPATGSLPPPQGVTTSDNTQPPGLPQPPPPPGANGPLGAPEGGPAGLPQPGMRPPAMQRHARPT
jgi:general secretion pathway protein C